MIYTENINITLTLTVTCSIFLREFCLIIELDLSLFSVLLNFLLFTLAHVYFDILSLVLLELVRLMLSLCLTMIRLPCC